MRRIWRTLDRYERIFVIAIAGFCVAIFFVTYTVASLDAAKRTEVCSTVNAVPAPVTTSGGGLVGCVAFDTDDPSNPNYYLIYVPKGD
jgi:hypothetical protein